MAINTGYSPAGVNVNIAGAVQIQGQGLVGSGTCTGVLAGTFDMKEGCFYFCDGRYRHSLNAAFSDAVGTEEQNCEYVDRCDFDGIKLRP
jgi:hypothetical protein